MAGFLTQALEVSKQNVIGKGSWGVLRRVFFLVSFFSKSMGGMTDDDICPRSIYVWGV